MSFAYLNKIYAQMAELVDALGSGPSEVFLRGGSSPLLGTTDDFSCDPDY